MVLNELRNSEAIRFAPVAFIDDDPLKRRRDEIKLNCSELDLLISNNTILVAGGGGSIGSELCRRIVKFNPKQLIIFDTEQKKIPL